MKFIKLKILLPLIATATCLTLSSCGGNTIGTIDEDGGTEGLEYALGDDGAYACSGIGTAENVESIKIAATHGGKAVTGIEASAFYGGMFKEITLPDSISSIGRGAFSTCNYLTKITLPSAVTVINESTLYSCVALKEITMGESVESIGPMAFMHCIKLTQINIPNTVNHIGTLAFSECEKLSSITLPESLTKVENKLFLGCTSLSEVFIPKSVLTIGTFAFYNCSALSRIYYGGSENDWANVEIGEYNEDVTEDIIYYYSEQQPSSDGNYWYYDGENITVW